MEDGGSSTLGTVLLIPFQSFVEQIPIRVADVEDALNPTKQILFWAPVSLFHAHQSKLCQFCMYCTRRNKGKVARRIQVKPVSAKELGLPTLEVREGEKQPPSWAKPSYDSLQGGLWIRKMFDHVNKADDIERILIKRRGIESPWVQY